MSERDLKRIGRETLRRWMVTEGLWLSPQQEAVLAIDRAAIDLRGDFARLRS